MRLLRRISVGLVLGTSLLCAGAAAADAHGAGFVWSRPFQAASLADEAEGPPPSRGDITCPSVHFCAIGAGYSVWTSTTPTRPRPWRQRRLLAGANGISQLDCASRRLCLGIGVSGLVASADPTGGRGAWRTPGRGESFTAATCDAAGPCALTTAGVPALDVSRDPAALRPSWRRIAVPVTDDQCLGSSGGPCPSVISAAVCPSLTLCLITDGYGQLLTGSDLGASTRWQRSQILPAAEQDEDLDAAFSCPEAHFCALEDGGRFFTSTDPGAPAPSWNGTRLPVAAEGALTCPTAHLCVGNDADDQLAWSSDPTAPVPTWHAQDVEGGPGDALADGLAPTVACPTSRECLLLDSLGRVLVGHLHDGSG